LDAVIGKILTDFGERETEQNWERIEEGFKRASECLGASGIEQSIEAIRKVRHVLVSSVSTDSPLDIV